MQKLICPECGEVNEIGVERCRECDATLADVTPSEIPDHAQTTGDDFTHLSEAENDLPGLLHALKQEGDIAPGEDSSAEEQITPSPEAMNIFDTNDEDDEQIPDWLERIRQRASEETDSVGEITQKIFTAKENLAADEEGSPKHEDFESWITRLREQARDKAAGKTASNEEILADNDEGVDEGSDWLSKIREQQGVPGESEAPETEPAPDQSGDSLLQWLVALEDGKGKPRVDKGEHPEAESDGIDEATHQIRVSPQKPDMGLTQPIETGEPDIEEVLSPKLQIGREEQIQTDKLTAAIADERAPRPVREAVLGQSSWLIRVIVAIVLIGGLSLSLFIGGNNVPLPQGLLQSHNTALLDEIEGLPADSDLLLVFDYQAGYSGEIGLMAQPILSSLVETTSELFVLSSKPSGALLYQQLFSEMDPDGSLTINNLGYYPVPAYGALGVANQTLAVWESTILPEAGKPLPVMENLGGIFLLSDNADSAIAWVQQLSTLMPDTPLHLLVTAQAGPMLRPYWESGQVDGFVSGLSEAAALETELAVEAGAADRWRAYRTGVLIMIVLLVLGAVYADDSDFGGEGGGTS